MACPVCGNAFPCFHNESRGTILVDPEVAEDSEQQFARSLERPAVLPVAANSGAQPQPAYDEQYWRQEVASRVQQHRARRRRRTDPNATMELDFASEGVYAVPDPESPSEPLAPVLSAVVQPAGVSQEIVEREIVGPDIGLASEAQEAPVALPAGEPAIYMPSPDDPRPEPYKIIEFPRPAQISSFETATGAEDASDLELADPVLDTPRILDAPEPEATQMDLLQSFADIELEEQPEPAGIEDLPPAPAPLELRVFAGLVDALIMLAAGLLFFGVFLLLASGLPPMRLLLPSVAITGAILWLLYQYGFLVHSAGTPGMVMAQLELYTFDGKRAPLPLRRRRALAAMLSVGSLGLGYLWAYVDEDALCWHDRITGTCVKEILREDL